MTVSARAVHNISQNALARHIKRHKLTPAVAAVFHKHKLCACFLISAHKLAAVVNRICSARLKSYIFSRVHCRHGNLGVRLPRYGYIHRVKLFNFKQLFIIREFHRAGKACLFQFFRCCGHPIGQKVANRGYFYARAVLHHRYYRVFQHYAPALTKPYYAYFYIFFHSTSP